MVALYNGRDIVFHDPANQNRLTWDLREKIDPANQAAFQREQLAEAIRLLYVAVTRARNRCYLFWAVTRDSAKANNCALAQAFGCGSPDGSDTAMGSFELLAAEGLVGLHEAVSGEAEGRYQVAKTDPGGLNSRVFVGGLSQSPLITSFSGLTARAHDEAPDRDALPEVPLSVGEQAEAPLDPKRSIFTFPKGAKAGNFFHGILEQIDFTRPEELGEVVTAQLATYQFDSEYIPVVTKKLQELLALDLADGLKLADIGWRDRLVEAPLYFPIKPVTPAELAEVFSGEDLPVEFSRGVGRLGFYPVDGYMTGFIDLVVRHDDRFYIIDWKSNWLGAQLSDYQGPAMERAMAESYYYLQYHLYTLALHRHLASTLPGYDYERDFGGVFYVFLRGIDAGNPASGIFRDLPPRALIENLQDVLMPGAEMEVSG